MSPDPGALMTVHILTDSSHYLDPATIAALNIHVLPLTLHLASVVAAHVEPECVTMAVCPMSATC
jgi:fatty acid-binding protein DegV